MGRTHHRKKHKQNLRQFKQSHDTSVSSPHKARVKLTTLFSIIGAAIGFAVPFFASLATSWIVVGLIAGFTTGYYLGRRIDKE